MSNLQQQARSVEFDIDAKGATTLAIKRFFFPSWKFAAVIPGPAKLGVYHGLMAMRLPAGQYHVALAQPWLPGEKDGATISGAVLAVLLAWFGVARWQRRRQA